MKSKFTLFAFLLCGFFAAQAQQVPNSSFDSWATDTLTPDGWSTYESAFQMNIGLASKDAADFIVGPYSLKLEADSVPGLPNYGVLAGTAALGSVVMGGQGPSFPGIAFPYRPDTLYIGYKFSSPGADSAYMTMQFRKNGTSALVQNAQAVGFKLPPTPQWTLVGTLLNGIYLNGTIVPDTLAISLYASKNPQPGGGIKGSTFKLDAILFGYAQLPNALQQVADDFSFNVFPNPATEFVTFTAKQNADGFRAVIADVNGAVVAGQFLTGETTRMDVSTLANGTYIYRIADKDGNVLKQGKFNVVK